MLGVFRTHDVDAFPSWVSSAQTNATKAGIAPHRLTTEQPSQNRLTLLRTFIPLI